MTGYLGIKDDEDLLREENARLRAEVLRLSGRAAELESEGLKQYEKAQRLIIEVKRLEGLIVSTVDALRGTNMEHYHALKELTREARRIRGEK